MPLGSGVTVEGQVTGDEAHGGLQIACFEPKPGLFPDQPPQQERFLRHRAGGIEELSAGAPAQEMGLAAGGRMRQKIYPDPHGIETWDQENRGRVFVHIVNSRQWTEITGEPLPTTPVSAETYLQAGLPWFDLYDDGLGDIAAPGALKGVRPVSEGAW